MAEVTVLRTKTPADGFRLAEGPRWHEGRLWISDIFSYRIHTVALDGTVETAAAVPQTSALWLSLIEICR